MTAQVLDVPSKSATPHPARLARCPVTLSHGTARRSRRRRLRDEDGVNLIEFAMVFPLLLMVVLGIVDFSFIFQRQQVLTNAAREGARVAVLPGYLPADVENRIDDYLLAGGIQAPAANVDVNVTLGTIPIGGSTWPATTVNIRYTYDYMFIGGIVGWFGGGGFDDITLEAQATMRHEMRP